MHVEAPGRLRHVAAAQLVDALDVLPPHAVGRHRIGGRLGLGAVERQQGGGDIVVFVGGVVPAQDYDFLFKAGAKGIFGPGTPIPDCAHEVLRAIRAAHAPASV